MDTLLLIITFAILGLVSIIYALTKLKKNPVFKWFILMGVVDLIIAVYLSFFL